PIYFLQRLPAGPLHFAKQSELVGQVPARAEGVGGRGGQVRPNRAGGVVVDAHGGEGRGHRGGRRELGGAVERVLDLGTVRVAEHEVVAGAELRTDHVTDAGVVAAHLDHAVRALRLERIGRVEAVGRVRRRAQRGAEVDRVGQGDVGALQDQAGAEREAVGEGD